MASNARSKSPLKQATISALPPDAAGSVVSATRSSTLRSAQEALLNWYLLNRRSLPWRLNHDPYRIWISEVMLQQTTVAAVIPYYERFLTRFPDLRALASAELEDVLELWSGLGYYSRARNLFKAAKALHGLPHFPQTFTELLAIAGFGPYTSRAVSSIAFDEAVGVLDGNVIRVLSRVHGFDDEWWKPAIRARYQEQVDEWVRDVSAREMNQALMELGATVCTPKSPTCLTCPLFHFCEARKQGRVQDLPRLKPRREMEIWIWEIWPALKGDKITLVKNSYAPFLKGQWVWPGQVTRAKKAPREFDYFHTVTHHKIYVKVHAPSHHERVAKKTGGGASTKRNSKLADAEKTERLELTRAQLKRTIPTALILKAVPFIDREYVRIIR